MLIHAKKRFQRFGLSCQRVEEPFRNDAALRGRMIGELVFGRVFINAIRLSVGGVLHGEQFGEVSGVFGLVERSG